jgi:NAD(P)-dependent dehydrogenase (short-subunit alcohol dehydrogenase family)
MRLVDRVAVVTGGGAGIGKAIANRFALEGAHVVIAEFNETTGRQAVAEIAALNRRASFVRTDLGQLGSIQAMVKDARETFGRIDVLVNNAGVTRKLDFFEVTEPEWDRMYTVNAKGVFFCMQAVARVMVEQGAGRIINMASIAGKGYRDTSNIAYAGTKGAVIAMTRVGASQLARHNINVNAICPGVTRTDMVDGILKGAAERQGISEADVLARMSASIPLGRPNNPVDIANLAAFLASDEAQNITGQSFNVDGGLMWD